jgi:uncharacterized delta-60 repeat protein
VRYDTNGGLDTTFGGTGIVTTAVEGFDDTATAVIQQPDGKLVAAGHAVTTTGVDFALVRYNVDGSLDGTFGTGGIATTTIGMNAAANALVRQPDGKLVAAGITGDADDVDFVLARYDASGNLDAGFGSGGTVTTAFGPGIDWCYAVVLQTDGKLVAAGTTPVSSPMNVFALVRYESDGSLDPTFGNGGRLRTAVGTDATAFAVVQQPDGKLVAAGRSETHLQGAFGLVRYD